VTDMSAEQIAEFIKPLRRQARLSGKAYKDFDPATRGLAKKKAGSCSRQGVKLLADYRPARRPGHPRRSRLPAGARRRWQDGAIVMS